MKNVALILTASVVLAACTGVNGNGISLGVGLGGMLGNHVGIGTSVNIPLGNNTPSTETTMPQDNIITHFDANGAPSDSGVKNGFYRKLLSKPSESEYLVQDFYEMGGSKRTDPMILSREQLHTFRVQPANGTLTVYAVNGNVMQSQIFKDGKLLK
ncbi:NemA protein [Alysiella filiformis DSM 16848]|uniref:NemA protein n=2 Tax=Alysiella TaxID=194195 RepID=A0A286E513_9NEIS|nr:NemA protein [Alysiella filiformis]QMT32483.1 NemA protein [Alysiella filiformis]UBQ57296.1 NemA protein [Alysiella filiformis DSM 16848]SOD65969.1 hypothetical protein SAMN02746062_00455 [Alysiella filiformis DSM 16848]